MNLGAATKRWHQLKDFIFLEDTWICQKKTFIFIWDLHASIQIDWQEITTLPVKHLTLSIWRSCSLYNSPHFLSCALLPDTENQDVREVIRRQPKKRLIINLLYHFLSAEVYFVSALIHSSVNLEQLPWHPWSWRNQVLTHWKLILLSSSDQKLSKPFSEFCHILWISSNTEEA